MQAYSKLKKRYSVTEYFSLEERSSMRHEYHEGELYAMAGGTKDHENMVSNLQYLLRRSLEGSGKSCRVYGSNMKIHISHDLLDKYLYADVSITCHPDDWRGQESFIEHPALIAEVLSKATALYDRTDKFRHYLAIPGFHEYLLINQWEQSVEYRQKGKSGKWTMEFFTAGDIYLETLQDVISVEALYGKLA